MYLFTMPDERALAAISRIERAIARIEGASARQPAASDGAELEALRRRHGQLRQRVEGAIGEIDRLLATHGG